MIAAIDNSKNFEGAEDVPGAVGFFLAELAKGPFAPALAGDVLDRFRIPLKLADFIRLHLADRVTLITKQEYSPVGRPALALTAQVHDPAYWQAFRLSSLYRVWPEVRVDMGALARQRDEEAVFARQFPRGLKVHGRIVRRTYGSAGFVVEVDVNGQTVPCLLPSEAVPAEFRATPEVLVGMAGSFEVSGTLPAKRSVLLRVLQLEALGKMQSGGDSAATYANVLKRLLVLRSQLDLTRSQLDLTIADIEAEAKRGGGVGNL